MSAARRVLLQPAFLLHHRPWSDSSRILDLLTRDHGRVTLFARGVRRARSPLASTLQPFMALVISWAGKSDGGTLTGAERVGEPRPLPPEHLMSGFYLNELALRLVPHEEAQAEIFGAYAVALEALARPDGEQPALRQFEKMLLEQLGYGLDLAREAGVGEPLDADRYYHFRPGHGVWPCVPGQQTDDDYLGRDLLALATSRLDTPDALRAAKRLLRAALEHCLEGRGLRSREVMLALRRQEGGS